MNGSSHDGNQKGQEQMPTEAGLSERRDRLNRILDDHKEKEAQASKRSSGNSTGYAQAVKMSSEFIAGIVVGGGIGWVLDQWAGTSPFGLIVFLLLGFAAGVLNVLRAAGQVAQPGAGAPRKTDKPD